ncbi:efflux RND transporter periplasmic adaptor subunit [Anaeromyxobacter diazotrophicus]|uniref:MexX family efflux pump subunit n=1 Tax=Anaeromyxobacter diazotrophicus TaxID=2590199 RepID=A0A7I9VJZ6_9BACT|nr:efflux RND transporter periplasmic adaptor subunit [Anaeromyxobacter diazotrophicus]GEJ56722.1 MexX family efflux pump subunit [Anaeromyxobacter diazotrophicus]
MPVRSKLYLAVALAGVLSVLGGCRGQKAPPPPPAPEVTVAPVARRDLPIYVDAVATLDGFVNAEIRARVRGFLEQQRYPDGAPVKEGQLLFTIERSEYEAAVATARAAVARAESARAHARPLLARKRELAKVDGVSQQELEDAQAQDSDSEAQVQAARAQLRQAELNLSYTQVRSPISGVAGLALVRPGNLVGADGPTLLTTVSQVDLIRVTFPLSEGDYLRAPGRLRQLPARDAAWVRQQLPRLDRGGETVDGDPGVELVLSDGTVYRHRGVVVAVNRQIDPTTGTLQLQALFPNPERLLRPGQYGRVRLRQEGVGQGALVVPEKALSQIQGLYTLAVVGADEKVQLRQVKVGPGAGALRIVLDGVKEGERVVVDGLQAARDGVRVTAREAQTAALTPAAPPVTAAP